MNIAELLHDKTMKPKEKTDMLCLLLEENKIGMVELIGFASTAKEADKATCI